MKAKAKKSTTLRFDGWYNVMAGFGRGQEQFDKLQGAVNEYTPMPDEDSMELYGASDIAAKIVDELPHEALREGFELKFKGVEKFKADIEAQTQELNLIPRFNEGWSWGRCNGGAGVVMVPRNVKLLATPLDLKNPDPIKNLLVVNRRELVMKEVENNISFKNFGYPRLYSLCPQGGEGNGQTIMDVHHSRVIRFDGVPLPRQLFILNNYWGDSVLNRAQDAIRNYDTAHHSAALALQDFSIAVWKLKDLAVQIQENGDEDVVSRMQLLNLSRSVARCIVLDAENESYEWQERSLTGVTDVINRLAMRLVSASDHMPHTKLLGESPSGLGATGRSEESVWYDFVASRQQNYLKPKLIKFFKAFLGTKGSPTNGKIPPDLDLEFKPLSQLTPVEQATARYTQAQADHIYIDDAVVDPIEVRESRFGSGKYTPETQLSVTGPIEPPDAKEPVEPKAGK